MNNLNISHLRRNNRVREQYDVNYYQPQNKDIKIESNTDGNTKITHTPEQKNNKEGKLKEYSSKKSPLFVISSRIFK